MNLHFILSYVRIIFKREYMISIVIYRFFINAFLILQVKVPALEYRVIITDFVTEALLFPSVFAGQDFREMTVQNVRLFILN